MRSTNRKRALIVSGSVILLCMSIVVGMTWALFTDTKTVTNHLVAGDLKITLNRTSLVKTTLDDKGYLVEQDPITKVENFTNATDENVFGLTMENGVVTEKVVPGSKFVATMQVANNSDVAFKYWAKIDCKNESMTKALAEQLIITVYLDKNNDGVIDTEGDDAEKYDAAAVSSELDIGDDINYIDIVEKDSSKSFVISVEFEDKKYSYVNGVLSSENNAAKNQEIDFDLIVYAVQVTKPTTP